MSSSHQSRRRRQQRSFQRHQLRLEGLEKRYALNAAPVLDDSASPTLGSILEDTGAPVGPAGTLVSDLIDAGGPLDNFSDVDGDQPGIAITDTNLQGGTLWYSRDDGVSWFDVGVLSDTQPLLMPAASGSRLYYEPAPDFNGTIADVFTIEAWDQNTVLEQIGQDLIGEANGDLFGRGVTISADGSTVVVGGMKNDSQAADAGHARVFRWNGTSWSQLGTDIEGLAPLGFFGFRVVVSDNGNRIAVSGHESNAGGSYSGLVQVYEWDGVNWLQLGQDLVGNPGDLFGHALAHSGDLSVLAVGAHHGGYVEIYKWNGITWEQRGTRIVGDHTGDGIGSSETLSISHDGNVLSTGRVWADTNGVNSGLVRVYEWASHDWVQRGADILGQDANEYFARTALSGDGNTLAVGASDGDGARDRTGRVAVYRWSGQAWHQLGNSLYGSITGEQFGASVAISHDGGTIVVGADRANGGLVDSGKSQVYRFIGSDWHPIGSPIYGTTSYQRLGVDVDISQDGSTIIVGAIFKNHSIQPGLARVYGINASDSSTSTDSDTVSIDVQALNDTPVLQGDQSISLAQVQEDSGAPVGAVGSLVSELIDASGPRNNFSDVDGDLPGIAIVEQELQGGTLWHSLDNGVTWEAVGTASEGEPFLLFSDSATRLYYQPAADFSGTLTSVVKFRAWDGNASWEKVGLDLVGSGDGDLFGRSVAISTDGFTVAVGGHHNDKNGADSGEVRVYTWSGDTWTQLGEDIVGDAAGDKLGFTLDLSADGRRLVVGMSGSDLGGDDAGAVRVFEWSGTAWVQLGSNITGTNPGDSLHSVTMSNDGSIIAAGSSVSDYVNVYRWDGIAWQQLGSSFTGTGLGSNNTLSLSKDGTVIALGAAGPDDTPANSGVVRVFQWFNNEWVQLGNEIQGDLEGGFFSRTSLSADGMTLAVGAYSAAHGVYYGAGYVRVFRVGSSGWQQMGADLVGNAWSDKFGWSVSLSDNGNRVVIGSDESNGNSAGWGGEVQAFRWDGADWLTEGQIINGAANNSRIGIAVDSSTNGNIFVAGSYQDNVSGRASVFRRVAAPGSTSSEIGELSVEVLPVNDAPVLDTNSSPTLGPIAEDASVPVGQVGTLVSSLIDTGGPLNNFSDIDGDLPGIAITGTNLQGGTLWYSTDDGATWLDVGAVSETEPQLLAADANTRLYFQPAADFSGTINDVLSFKAWDNGFIWQQIGLDIEGETFGDYSGKSLSLSTDGETVAIGGYLNDGNGTDSGHVRIYRWSGAEWIQLGDDLDGEAANDWSGFAVSIAADGETIAVSGYLNDGNGTDSGHVRIYRWSGAEWIQLGDDLDGEAANDWSGFAVSIAADGETIAVGARHNDGNGSNSGHARIYRWSGAEWIQLGGDLDGEYANDSAGYSVSLSADGETIAVGARYNDGNGTNSGHVRIYRWSGAEWIQLGGDLDGQQALEHFGYSISLAADGGTVAIGAYGNDQNGPEAGTVRVFHWTGTAWNQQGSDINGINSGDSSGNVSLSADGEIVLIGADRNDGNGFESGHVRIFNWTGADWIQVGADIYGDSPGDRSGWWPAISPSGNVVAIDGTRRDANGTDSGHVRIFKFVPSVSTVTGTISVTVDPVNDPPTLDAINGVTVLEDSPEQLVSLTGITAGGSETQPLRVTATSNNPDLIPNPTVTYASTDTTGSLAFTPVVDANGTATITVTVEDGGNDNILATVSDNLSYSQTFDVVVEPVNDRPVLNPTASPQLSPIAVGSGSPVGAVGTLVSALIDAGGPLANYSDVDGDLPGIAITGVNLLDGKLWFSTDGGETWGDVGAVSESNVRVLAADALTRVYYEPLISSGTTISDVLQYKAWDGTNGAMNGDLVGDGRGSLLERPKQIGVFGSSVEDYVISSNNARGYLIGPTGFSIYDISNPILPVLVGQEATFLSYSAGSRVWLSSDESFAFCASSINVNVYDIRDPTQPTLVSTYVMDSANYYVAYSARSDRLYVPSLEWNEQSNQDLVVRVFDTSNPYQLEDLGELRFGNIGVGRSLRSSFLSPDDTLLYISQRVTNNGVTTGYVDVVDVSGDELVSVRLAGSVLPEPEYEYRFGNHAVNADGSLIAIAGETVVFMLKVGDAGAIELVDQIQLPSTAFGLAFSGNTNELVVCYDKHVNFYTPATAGGYALTGSVAGGRYKVQTRTSGSNVFALTGSSSSAGALGAVGIFDVSSGYSPLVVGTEGVGSRLRDVALSADGSVLFAANGWGEWGTLDIYAVANPGMPSLLASLSTPGGADAVAVSSEGEHLYVADGVSGLRIYDVSNPASPVVVNVVVLGGDVTGVVLDENRSLAYVTDESAGVHVVDISNAQNAQRVVTFNPEYNGSGKGARDVAISEDGSLLYVSSFSGLSVHQISGVADVQQLWFGAGPGYFGEVLRAGDVLFVCQDRDKGLHAYDLSAPMEPLLIGRYFDSVLDVGVSHDSNELYVVTQGTISYGADFHGVIVCDLDAFLDVAEKGASASSRYYDVVSTSVVIDTVVGGPESVALSADGGHIFVGSWGHLSYPSLHVVDLNQQVEEATAYSLQSDSVSVIVTAVNEPPTLDAITSVTVLEDSPEQSVSLTGITAGGSETQPLRVTATSNNPDLIPNPIVSYTSPNVFGSLVFTPNHGVFGETQITVTVEDAGLDGDLGTSEDNLVVNKVFDVEVFELLPYIGSQALARNSLGQLHVGTQQVLLDDQPVLPNIHGFRVLGTEEIGTSNSLLVARNNFLGNETRYRLVTDESWRINGLFHSLHNESSLPLNPSARELSNTFNISAVSGAYVINGVNNPTLTVRRGQTYIFNLNTGVHRLWLQTTGGGYQSANVYDSEFTGNSQTTSEHQWVVPADAPDELFYQCEFHPVMFGKIIVVD